MTILSRFGKRESTGTSKGKTSCSGMKVDEDGGEEDGSQEHVGRKPARVQTLLPGDALLPRLLANLYLDLSLSLCLYVFVSSFRRGASDNVTVYEISKREKRWRGGLKRRKRGKKIQ